MNQVLMASRRQQVLYDKKWKKFLRRARFFSHIPFIEFALGAGSLAVGNVSEDSDFDVIVGVRPGRIWTARFFAVAVFGIFGWRRSRLTHRESASDKICLNHFVTLASYALKSPHTDSWRELYKNIVPVWGDSRKIEKFFEANMDWMHLSLRGVRDEAIPVCHCEESATKQSQSNLFINDLRFSQKPPSPFKKSLEFILSGHLGNLFERVVSFFQIKKIKHSLKKDLLGYKPRIIYNDEELEFHPDRRKFEA